MTEAPRDGTIIVVVYSDQSGLSVCFWGERAGKPDWWEFMADVGDYRETREALVDDASYGWVPFPLLEEEEA